mgnify:CR=1 FL=1
MNELPPRGISDVLERMAAITESASNMVRPSDENTECPMCLIMATEVHEHDPDCAYRLALAGMSPDDVRAVRRLARAMRHESLCRHNP